MKTAIENLKNELHTLDYMVSIGAITLQQHGNNIARILCALQIMGGN